MSHISFSLVYLKLQPAHRVMKAFSNFHVVSYALYFYRNFQRILFIVLLFGIYLDVYIQIAQITSHAMHRAAMRAREEIQVRLDQNRINNSTEFPRSEAWDDGIS